MKTECESWQVAEIKKALQEADAGDFATDEEMAVLDAKWKFVLLSMAKAGKPAG